ncbi:MAG: hypothetical protein DME22_20430, partial [Verrucomicrobia bacterium]
MPVSVFGADILPPGHRPTPPGVHALAGGKVVVKPDEVIEGATIVIRDGFIQAIGKDVTPPADARVWEMKGTTIYAGFIDPCLTLNSTNRPINSPRSEFDAAPTAGGVNFFGVPGGVRDPGRTGPGYEAAQVTPEARVARSFAPDKKALDAIRQLGFTAGNVVPEKGVLRGTSAFVALSDVNPNNAIIDADTFQHIAFDTAGGKDDEYPKSLMGVIALIRQTFFDAEHYAQTHDYFRQHPQGRKRPEFNPPLEALTPAVARKMPVVFEPGSALMLDRAARLARELDLNFYILSCGQEWRRPDLAKDVGAPFIVPLDFPELPKMPEEQDWEQVSLDQLRAWDWAPENAAWLRQQGREIALTTYGLSDKKNFRKNLRLALDRGLTENDALAALTTIPARLCGVADRLGTIEVGKVANLTVVQGGGYFGPENKVREVWIDGRVYSVNPAEAKPAEKKESVNSEPDKDGKSGEERKKKQEELRELRKKRVAHSPLEDRGPLADFPAILVRGATIWTCGPPGILTNAELLVVDGRIAAVGHGLLKDKEFGGKAAFKVEATGLHVTPGLVDCHNHSIVLGAVNEGTLPSTSMVRIGDVVNSESVNVHRQLAGGLTTLNLLHGSANPIGGQNAILKLRDGASPEGMKFANAPPGIKFALGENVKQSNTSRTNRFPQTR